MDIGFETIGNATLIFYDRKPVLVTDPWIKGSAYFGSWTLAHQIPEEQMESIKNCEFVWISHGHPDHLSSESLKLLSNKKILLPDHVGGRIFQGFKEEGYNVHILKDRVWNKITDHIKIMSICDYNQDAVLLVDINGRLVVNTNDASDHGWQHFVKKVITNYEVSFLLSLSGFGDADMINFFDENGRRIPPPAAQRFPVGQTIAARTEMFGARYFVPFSSMHKYQRKDSIWANQYTTALEDYPKGFKSESSAILPAYIKYDCVKDSMETINPPETPRTVFDPEYFGDNWDEPLERTDVESLAKYFKSISHLEQFLDYINVRVGGKDNLIELNRQKFHRGITFEAPRHSLMVAVTYEIFDDMLIGNFMKTTLHGKWGKSGLYPDFTPFVAKYADNGRAKTPEELHLYFEEYKQRASFDFLRHRFQQKAMDTFRFYLPKDSGLYRLTERAYYAVRKVL
jgi:hypothetical protein